MIRFEINDAINDAINEFYEDYHPCKAQLIIGKKTVLDVNIIHHSKINSSKGYCGTFEGTPCQIGDFEYGFILKKE